MAEPQTFIPAWMLNTEGADGWERRMVTLLRHAAGNEAAAAMTATDFRARALHQEREHLFDAIASRIMRELPPSVDGPANVR